MSRFLLYFFLLPITFLAGCSGVSKLSEVRAKHLADEKVKECFGNREGINVKSAFTGSGQFKQGWMFEYKFDDELCAILVGYDGSVELSRTKQ